jgi:uroporphyrinogen decarboxylase
MLQRPIKAALAHACEPTETSNVTEMDHAPRRERLTSQERVLTAISLHEPDRVPVTLSFYPTVLPQTGGNDADEQLGTDVRFVEFDPPSEQSKFLQYLERLPARFTVGNLRTLRTYSEWEYHPERLGSEPLANARTLDDVKSFSFPNLLERRRHQHLREKVQRIHSRGLAVAGLPPHMGGEIFEAAQRLRGFEQLMSDFFRNPEYVEYLFNQLASIASQSVAILAAAGVDVICLDDDVGEPSRMMIGPDLWRQFLKDPLSRIISTARVENPAVRILYHSDGCIEPIIPDLIEIGVNAINPVQPDVMEPAALKKKYGKKLAFWGTVGTASDWVYGSPSAIESEVKNRIETVGNGGGLVITPAYDLEPDVKWDNVLAFVRAVQKYG